jgi:hypothetical protein
MTGVSWAEFCAADLSLAEHGSRLLFGDDGVAVAFLATAAADGAPHLAPVTPVFSRGGLFLVATADAPEVDDLRDAGGYALHALPGADDAAFQVRGGAREVTAPDVLAAVHADDARAAWDPRDPVFELQVASAALVTWSGSGGDRTARRRDWCL